MAGIPNALIGVPDEMAKYDAQPPDAPKDSAGTIVSGLPGGQRFATADETATARLMRYCQRADQGIRGFRSEAGEAANQYMTTEQLSQARIDNVVSPNSYVGTRETYWTPRAAQAPIPDPVERGATPLLGGF